MPTQTNQGKAFQSHLLNHTPELKHRAEWLAQDAESLRWHYTRRPFNEGKVNSLQVNITQTCARDHLLVEFQPDTRGLVVKVYTPGRQFVVGL